MISPEWIRRLPRGWRIALCAMTMLVTVVILIPAIIVGAGHLAGFDACDRPDYAAVSYVCYPAARPLFAGVLIAIGVPLVLRFTRFLKRIFRLTDDANEPVTCAVGGPPRQIPARRPTALPGWQCLVSGEIAQWDKTKQTIVIDGKLLTFWSTYAFRKGWLNQGDRTAIVYQRTPLTNLNLAMAFFDGRLSAIRGVAVGAQTASISIGVLCILIFVLFNPPFLGIWIALCVVLSIMSALYLVLMLRARSALRHFVDSEVAQ
ncbi:MAG TPA: hypothetical protein VGM97_11240 [Steroidobacteraceae bacterium]